MKKTIYSFLFIFLLSILYFQLNNGPLTLNQKEHRNQAEIQGEVKNPGIYTISKDETLESLIQQAEGCTVNADLSSFSLQQKILHQDVIVIPQKTESKKVSLNHATLEELMTLSGIGASKATKIIEYRQQFGFHAIDEIMNVKGIGIKIFEKNKDLISL